MRLAVEPVPFSSSASASTSASEAALAIEYSALFAVGAWAFGDVTPMKRPPPFLRAPAKARTTFKGRADEHLLEIPPVGKGKFRNRGSPLVSAHEVQHRIHPAELPHDRVRPGLCRLRLAEIDAGSSRRPAARQGSPGARRASRPTCLPRQAMRPARRKRARRSDRGRPRRPKSPQFSACCIVSAWGTCAGNNWSISHRRSH